jgi:plastocyanin
MLPKAMVVLLGLMILFPVAGFATIHQVNISGFDFVPPGSIIAQGDSIRWTNLDAVTHSSVSDGGFWNTGPISPGLSHVIAFASAGVFPYHCVPHTTMLDTITVLAPADVEISIGDNFFDPPVVRINIGETVRWTNNGLMDHTTTALDGAFDSGTLIPGATYSFTFNQEGVHDYECIFHLGMVGTIVVGTPDSVAADIQIFNMEFLPPVASVTAGQYVRWINLDPMAHTSTDTSANMWDSGSLEPGDFFIFQANTVGSFNYVCSFHPGMAGTLNVLPVVDQMIDIGEYFFDPAVVHIQPGQTVQWMNNGIRVHTTTADGGLWDSDSLSSGESFYFTFAGEGVYDYTCMMHPLLMKGTIVVGRPDSVAFDIRIIDFDFDPALLSITMGQNVRWVNFGSMEHTTTDTSSNAWDSGSLQPGDFFIYHADTPGDFDYICSIHPGQNGLLTVQDTATGSGCIYVPGDINGNGSANGIDVTFGVSYFKGGNPPPRDCGNPVGPCPQGSPFYAAGDVNGNCAFNGIDVTFYVAYLKGLQPALLHCSSCPPAPAGRVSR